MRFSWQDSIKQPCQHGKTKSKDGFDKAVCDGLAAQIKDKETQVATAGTDADKKKAQTALGALTDNQKSKGCPTSN